MSNDNILLDSELVSLYGVEITTQESRRVTNAQILANNSSDYELSAWHNFFRNITVCVWCFALEYNDIVYLL